MQATYQKGNQCISFNIKTVFNIMTVFKSCLETFVTQISYLAPLQQKLPAMLY